MTVDEEFVGKCGHCGAPSDGGPCDECSEPPDDGEVITFAYDRLPAIGGPLDGAMLDAARELIVVDAPSLVAYRRRRFIVGDPLDPEMAHAVDVFHVDGMAGMQEAAAVLRAVLVICAQLAGHVY